MRFSEALAIMFYFTLKQSHFKRELVTTHCLKVTWASCGHLTVFQFLNYKPKIVILPMSALR